MLSWADWSDVTYPFHHGIALFAFLSFPQWMNSSLLPGALGCPWPGHPPSDLRDLLVCEPSENHGIKLGASPEHAMLLPHLVISPAPPNWSVFHKSLHPWLSLLSSCCETFFFLFSFFPLQRPRLIFLSFPTESSLALGGKCQGTEWQLNTNSTSRQSSLWKLLSCHLPAYQMLWLNSSAFVLVFLY